MAFVILVTTLVAIILMLSAVFVWLLGLIGGISTGMIAAAAVLLLMAGNEYL